VPRGIAPAEAVSPQAAPSDRGAHHPDASAVPPAAGAHEGSPAPPGAGK
jgi:hypothetical protein